MHSVRLVTLSVVMLGVAFALGCGGSDGKPLDMGGKDGERYLRLVLPRIENLVAGKVHLRRREADPSAT